MSQHRESGFTLIELMIVVAIIGILSSIAIPNFTRFQAKAKQSEAKTNLKAMFTAKKTYAAEHETYVCGMCTYEPEKGARYTYAATPAIFILGLQDSPGFCGVTPFETKTGFLVMADANIDADPTCDAWTMDDNNQLVNTLDDVAN